MLLRFLADYAYEPGLRSRFARNPSEVLDEYHVSHEERGLFNPLDLTRIGKRMSEQVPEVLDRIVELREEWSAILSIYGTWLPVPVKINPREGKVGAQIPFTITGKLINFSATAYFERPMLRVDAKNVTVNEPGTILTGTVTLPDEGDYNVVIDNGQNLKGVLIRGFTAKK